MAKFIISHHRFKEHESFFQAQGEVARLQQLYPERDYQIFQVRRVPGSVAKPKVTALNTIKGGY